MNIKDAKQQILNAIQAYLIKDEFGDYRISIEHQRPVFLLGAPGIGKTAIMEQIAQETGVNLVTYSMSHHTRESALGLPVIVHRNYTGADVQISEYTMSEIVATLYDTIEATGIKEGILFLDEINCVSESLAPAMLQFLQYKVFGLHQVPAGWVVVTAGNPPEFNKSVSEFDIVTLDRVKRVECQPDFGVWKEYAYYAGVHPAIISYLELHPDHYYMVDASDKNNYRFVTARGWEDLSEMMQLYEESGILVDHALAAQYVQNPEFSKGLSKGELNSVLAAVGDIDKLIDPKAKGEQAMLIKYLGSTEEKIEKLLDYPELFAAPIVRNGKKATVGFCPEVWKSWE
jgi:arsenate reductase-like glutaredoxin family protein